MQEKTHRSQFEVISPPKNGGKVYVIGDVHGEIGALKKVLARLNTNDTLIILGDLIDRGIDPSSGEPGSAAVLDLFIKHQKAPKGTLPEIQCITGNHEMDFLRIMALFVFKNQYKHAADTENEQKIDAILTEGLKVFIRNGGGWIFRHDPNDHARHTRYLICSQYMSSSDDPSLKNMVSQYIHHLLKQTENLFSELHPSILEYAKLIADFPYVIKFEDEHPIWMVHADMPLSDTELEQRIRDNIRFSPQELDYLLNARVEKMQAAGKRHQQSTLVLTGHNIIDEPTSNKGASATLPVREQTNHINLDGGAYFTGGFLLTNLTDRQVEIVNRDITAEPNPLLVYARDTIQNHFDRISHAHHLDSEHEDDNEFRHKRPKI